MSVAGKRISELIAQPSPNLGAVVPIVDIDGNNYKVSLSNILSLASPDLLNIEDSGTNVINSTTGTGFFRWDNVTINNTSISSNLELSLSSVNELFLSAGESQSTVLSASSLGASQIDVNPAITRITSHSDLGSLSSNYSRISVDSTSNESIILELNSVGNGVSSLLMSNNLSGAIIVTDNISNKGIELAADYSANFTGNSLVTKTYVDSVASGSISNLIDSGVNVVNNSSGSLIWEDISINANSVSSASSLELVSATNADIDLIPNGTGTVKVPIGYESKVANGRDLINKAYFDSNTFSNIDNTGVSDNDVLIYNSASGNYEASPQSDLSIPSSSIQAGTLSGSFTFDQALTIGSVVYPSADGVSGQVLKTDGAGNLFFDSISSGFDVSGLTGGTFGAGIYTFPDDVLFANGTAVSPSIAFASDTDTGIYSSGTNELGIAANGVEVFTFGSSSHVCSKSIIPSGLVSLGSTSSPWRTIYSEYLVLSEASSIPSTLTGYATAYVDSADGDLKIRFGDGTVKTILLGAGSLSIPSEEIAYGTGSGITSSPKLFFDESVSQFHVQDTTSGSFVNSSVRGGGKTVQVYADDRTATSTTQLGTGITSLAGADFGLKILGRTFSSDDLSVNDPLVQVRGVIQDGSPNYGSVANRDIFAIYNKSAVLSKVGANGDWDFKTNKLSNIGTPTNDQDAATKKYVDDNIKSEKVTLTSTQIDNLGSGNSENLIAAPGVGKFIQLISVAVKYNHNTTVYGSSKLALASFDGVSFGNPIMETWGSPFSSSSGYISYFGWAIGVSVGEGVYGENEAVCVYDAGGSLGTIGDGSADFFITYRIVDL